jgi:hypothetical protein
MQCELRVRREQERRKLARRPRRPARIAKEGAAGGREAMAKSREEESFPP